MEGSFGYALLVMLAALIAGIVIQDPKAKLKTLAGAAGVLFFYFVIQDRDFGLAFTKAIYMFCLLFFFPFSIGTALQKRFNKPKGGQ